MAFVQGLSLQDENKVETQRYAIADLRASIRKSFCGKGQFNVGSCMIRRKNNTLTTDESGRFPAACGGFVRRSSPNVDRSIPRSSGSLLQVCEAIGSLFVFSSVFSLTK